MVKTIQQCIDGRLAGKVDFANIELNLRADLVMNYGVSIHTVAGMSDDQVYDCIDSMDEDYEMEEPDHIIKCRDCGADIPLANFTDNPVYGSGCGWDYKCSCGRTGFVWEGAFDEY